MSEFVELCLKQIVDSFLREWSRPTVTVHNIVYVFVLFYYFYLIILFFLLMLVYMYVLLSVVTRFRPTIK